MYTKSLRPFKKFFCPTFVLEKYPEFESLIDSLLKYIDTKNPLSFYDSSEEALNSTYHNCQDFAKHYFIENLPIENPELLKEYIHDFATGLDFRNQSLSFDPEVLRQICSDANICFNLKGTHAGFNFVLHELYSCFITDSPYSQTLLCRFMNTTEFVSIAQLPEYTAIATAESVLTEIPGYALEDNISNTGTIDIIREVEPSDGISAQRKDITAGDKGTHPFHYQIVSKSEVFKTGNFVRNLVSLLNPAGFHCEIFVEYDPQESFQYADCREQSSYQYNLECSNLP